MVDYMTLEYSIASAIYTWQEFGDYVMPIIYATFSEEAPSIKNGWNFFKKGTRAGREGFWSDLSQEVLSLPGYKGGPLIGRKGLDKIKQLVSTYQSSFDTDQTKMMETITGAMQKMVDSRKKRLDPEKYDVSKKTERDLEAAIAELAHLESYPKIKNFCDKCRVEIAKFYEEGTTKQLVSGDAENKKVSDDHIKRLTSTNKQARTQAINNLKSIKTELFKEKGIKE